ncbi:pyridoxal-phosphate dependent enzyme [Cupriavidus sp. UYPR2.512]|uniref:pyridoxal-phosphate dependent enzyme n=1 Tax=Cupriavidus sp. UYPR2.512 TaxID=1080187 RepID=UPI00036F7946|nr:pyridoxal-phosphate dependent enzyme [Cupriavidus sp. UYPR2.512]UIF89863.1 pyridoxal-phosphate dependent enzyme [Cupriavidus necator]
MTIHISTPFVQSQPNSRRLGKPVWLKMEAAQPTGSFKLRGVGALCEARHAAGAQRFVSSSDGNAGIAAAYCGRELGVPVVVVVPESTPPQARDLIRLEGSELIVHGGTWAEAHEFALSLIGPRDAFVHPFDDPLIWQGHATLVDEIAVSGPKPGAIVLAVGGGGLLCGVLEGLQRNGWSDVPVIAVETDGADCYARSVAQGRPVELSSITSVATSLGAKRPCDGALRWAQRHEIHSVVVSDDQAVQAAIRFLDEHRVLVEPACGAALTALDCDNAVLKAASSIAVVVCGGATVTARQLHDFAAILD